LNALETYFTYIFHIYFHVNIFYEFQDHANNLTIFIITWIRVKIIICQAKKSKILIRERITGSTWLCIKLHNNTLNRNPLKRNVDFSRETKTMQESAHNFRSELTCHLPRRCISNIFPWTIISEQYLNAVLPRSYSDRSKHLNVVEAGLGNTAQHDYTIAKAAITTTMKTKRLWL